MVLTGGMFVVTGNSHLYKHLNWGDLTRALLYSVGAIGLASFDRSLSPVPTWLYW